MGFYYFRLYHVIFLNWVLSIIYCEYRLDNYMQISAGYLSRDYCCIFILVFVFVLASKALVFYLVACLLS